MPERPLFRLIRLRVTRAIDAVTRGANPCPRGGKTKNVFYILTAEKRWFETAWKLQVFKEKPREFGRFQIIFNILYFYILISFALLLTNIVFNIYNRSLNMKIVAVYDFMYILKSIKKRYGLVIWKKERRLVICKFVWVFVIINVSRGRIF